MVRKKENKKQNDLTNFDDWRPTPLQIKMVELLVNPEDRRTKEAKCAEVGVKKQTLYNWLKKPEFVKYMNSQLDKYSDGDLPEIWRAFLMQCKHGNVDAFKYYCKIKKIDPEIQIKLAELEIKKRELELKEF